LKVFTQGSAGGLDVYDIVANTSFIGVRILRLFKRNKINLST